MLAFPDQTINFGYGRCFFQSFPVSIQSAFPDLDDLGCYVSANPDQVLENVLENVLCFLTSRRTATPPLWCASSGTALRRSPDPSSKYSLHPKLFLSFSPRCKLKTLALSIICYLSAIIPIRSFRRPTQMIGFLIPVTGAGLFLSVLSEISYNGLGRLMEGSGRRASSIAGLRYFSDDKGRVLSEEERAKENVYVQKWEREKLEKQRRKAEKEKAEREKSDKKAEGEGHKS